MKLLKFILVSAGGARNAKWLIFGAMLTGIIGGASNAALLAFINNILTRPGFAFRMQIRMFVLLCALTLAGRALSQILLTTLSIEMVVQLRIRLCRQIAASPLRKLEEIGLPRLLSAFTEDIPWITNAVTQLPNLCINAVVLLGCLAYMAWLSWQLLIVIAVAGVIGISAYLIVQKRARAIFARAHTFYVRLLKNFRGLVEGTKELQLHSDRRHEFLKNDIVETVTSLGKHRRTSSFLYALAENWASSLVFVAIGILLFLFSGKAGGSAHVITGFILVFLYVAPSVQGFLATIPYLSQADVAIQKIGSMQLSLPSAPFPLSDHLFMPSWKRLELKGIQYAYSTEDDRQFILGPLDLTIERGETVFITGGNGSGKTTLIKLLSGLYPPDQGEIWLDRNKITNSNVDHYRQCFSAIFSDFYLFDRLVGINSPDELAREYLELLQLQNKVTIDHGVFSTTSLSQGQRKRLALLTAYMEDRPIYIFDEWAADQDPAYREVFYYKLLRELKARRKTLIVVTHDDRYFHLADRLVKLEYGQMVPAKAWNLSQLATQAG